MGVVQRSHQTRASKPLALGKVLTIATRRVAPADPALEQMVRAWQDLGWSIAMHGYQHCYVSASSGIMGRNSYSEFSSLPESIQRHKLERGHDNFRREGIRPEAFIAPGHSFDDVTVRLLVSLGVDCLSDGYSVFPYLCQQGMLWIPQQLELVPEDALRHLDRLLCTQPIPGPAPR